MTQVVSESEHFPLDANLELQVPNHIGHTRGEDTPN